MSPLSNSRTSNNNQKRNVGLAAMKTVSASSGTVGRFYKTHLRCSIKQFYASEVVQLDANSFSKQLIFFIITRCLTFALRQRYCSINSQQCITIPWYYFDPVYYNKFCILKTNIPPIINHTQWGKFRIICNTSKNPMKCYWRVRKHSYIKSPSIV